MSFDMLGFNKTSLVSVFENMFNSRCLILALSEYLASSKAVGANWQKNDKVLNYEIKGKK